MTRVINRSFVRAKGWVRVARFEIATRASPYADRPSVTSCAQTHTMKTVQVSRRSASYRRVLAATAVLAVSHGIRGVHGAGWAQSCPDGSTVANHVPNGFHECKLRDGYYLKGAGTDSSGGSDTGIDIQPVPAGYWSTHAAPISLTTTTGTDVWDGTTDGALGNGNAAATSGVTKCPSDSGTSVTGSTTIRACKCDAEYKADTNSACVACPTGTDWISAPSVCDSFFTCSATFCEALKAGYYGTLGSGADATLLTACPSGGWTSAGLTSGGPTTIADCFQAASGITPDKTMYGKSGDTTNVYLCPTGTVNTAAAVAGTESYCSSIAAGYYGTQGTAGVQGPGGVHASSTNACPANSSSAESAATTLIGACECAADLYPSSNTCVACASGTTRAGTVSVTGTATCSAAGSAGASTPTAVALAAAAAVLLLL